MYTSPTEIERIARHRISERTAPTHTVPRPRRRTQLAGAIRRVADRLDD
jgi:hypothetical protein